jgi:1-aminocyclopropane-1-carboxylate deaminase/D-cysteine desulfhydrase-like pyridoxal-dependent ACC family enzyme
MEITIEKHQSIYVLRDDLLNGGTKSVLMDEIVKQNPHATEFVYASPVYGGFQIALSLYCKKHNLQATIFCAKRNTRHPNTLRCIENGANIVEIFPAYMTVLNKRATDYCTGKPHAHKIQFGANTLENINIITDRTKQIFDTLGFEPDEIWVAVGSGTIITGILQAVKTAKVFGILVGGDFQYSHPNVEFIRYPRPFHIESKITPPFPSMPNYDRKAFEICLERHNPNNRVLFWNVL